MSLFYRYENLFSAIFTFKNVKQKLGKKFYFSIDSNLLITAQPIKLKVIE